MTNDDYQARLDHPAGKGIRPSDEVRRYGGEAVATWRERQTLEFANLGQAGHQVTIPTKAHAGDAGWDLYVAEDTRVRAGEFVDVPCGVGCALPTGTWGLLTGRSSTLRNRGLLVHQGVIDEGYRGELFAGVFNLTREDVLVEAGARIAQLIVVPMHAHAGVFVDQLRPGEREARGFGSSGV